MTKNNTIFRSISILIYMLFAVDAAAESLNGFVIDDALIPMNEIRNGGPGIDGIPSLDNPVFVNGDAAKFLRPYDRVLGVALDGVSRAYPISILNYHEIVNDSVAGTPLVVTYCPLCGSGMAFLSTYGGKKLQFGVSGLLYNSDVLLYDRNSHSLWSQLLSTAVAGPMKGTQLATTPISNTSWREWKTRHPETQVLSRKTGYQRNYRANPYPNYGRSGKLYFPVAHHDSRYKRKAMVMGFEIDGNFKAYPFEELKRGPEQWTDRFQGQEIQVQFDGRNKTARLIDSDGKELPTVIAFWFAWYAFHPDTAVYTASTTN